MKTFLNTYWRLQNLGRKTVRIRTFAGVLQEQKLIQTSDNTCHTEKCPGVGPCALWTLPWLAKPCCRFCTLCSSSGRGSDCCSCLARRTTCGTSYKRNVCFVSKTSSYLRASKYWKAAPNDCLQYLSGALTSRKYFLRGTQVQFNPGRHHRK